MKMGVINYTKLIVGPPHPRLENIQILETSGDRTRARGWHTHRDRSGQEILVEETIDSSQTPFDPLILLVPPQFLGTHEATHAGWIAEASTDQFGTSRLDFEDGWHGSPIAVTAANQEIYQNLANQLKSLGEIGLLPQFKYGDLGILDGHHRVKMALQGKTKLSYVPVQLIPYLIDDCVIMGTWHNDGKILSPESIFRYFKHPKLLADTKRTKFGIRGKDGVIRRILDSQPEIHIPLENLL